MSEMVDLSAYTLEQLRKDSQLVVYRGSGRGIPGQILVVAPLSERFEHETIKRLEHEYALRTKLDSAWAAVPIALVRDKGRTALVLEDPGGEPLERLLEHPLELTRFLQIAAGLANALSSLHKRGIVHKDIKPGNVLVDAASGRVWLTGFGKAISLAREPQAPEPAQTIAGTLAYIAPEQTGRMNRSIDSRSDLYSLGVILYQMLTGTLPFVASDPLELVHCHIARLPVPPRERGNGVPEPLSAIILKLLAKSPEERYQTATGLEADLKRCLHDWRFFGRIDSFVIGANDIPNHLTISQKIYGREHERKSLFEAFERVIRNGSPEVVLVSGYSGTGKSSLINELQKATLLPGGILISGKFDQHKQDIPYATITQALQNLVRQLLSREDSALAYWRDALRDAVGTNAELLANIIPELELLIDKPPPAPELFGQDADNRFLSAFQAFLSVVARREHPLIIFLDDLQWLDTATLRLLERVIIRRQVQHLLFVLAFRDNEIGPNHPTRQMLDRIRKSEAIAQDIMLGPLSIEDVSLLISDSLHDTQAHTEPLAYLLYEKTTGNPFFLRQLFTSLTEEHLVEFDTAGGTWRWDLERIRARKMSDDVVELLIEKLNRLPDKALEILKQLACLGNSADEAILTLVRGGSEEELQSDLWDAMRGGFVIHSAGSYTFVHDRVREATYSLISEDMRAEVHLQIGRQLMARVSSGDLPEILFDIVNQVNRGVALISDENEKQRVAELNLSAGRKAKASTAYAAAGSYFSVAIALLGQEYWSTRYDLAFSRSLELAECEFLSGNLDTAEKLISELLVRARSNTDKVAAYCLRVKLYFMKSDYAQAAASALDCLRLLGIEMSAHPTAQAVMAEYEKVVLTLGERSIESLIDLPLMNNQEMRAAMRVLSVLEGPAFTTDSNLYYLCACQMASITLKCGTTDASSYGLALFGRVLGPLLRRYRDGYLLAKLGVELTEKHEFVAYKAKVYFTAALAAVWTEPMTAVMDLLHSASRAAVETGDLICLCYCYTHVVPFLLIRGDHLDEVAHEAEQSLDSLTKSNFVAGVADVLGQQQFIRCLQGQTMSLSSFNDAHFDEEAFERHLEDQGAWMTLMCFYWIRKLQAAFIAGRYEVAIAAAEKANAILWAGAGCIHLLDYHYYAALSIAGRFETASVDIRKKWRQALDVHLGQLRDWAEHGSVTFKNRYTLVSAEVARIEGRDLDARRLYEQAIGFARDHGFVGNEAIANEVAARFYFDRGFKTIGDAYIQNAHSNYLRWGAHAKVRNLEELYPVLREPAPHSIAALDATIAQLDLVAVVRALQAVSREIDLERLIETLMVSAVEHAGAERGLLFLHRGPEIRIEAQATTHSSKVAVIFSRSFAARPQFAEVLVRDAVRTLESVILEDGSVPNRFSDDAYVSVWRPRSILCLPLVRQREAIGVLYLENNLAPNVFTKDRLAVLELIASQAAISLKNAQLYADLQQENDERRKAEIELRQSTDALSQLQEELRQASRAAMMGELTASLAHELNQPLGGSLINAQAVRRLLTAKKPDLAEIKAAIEEIISDDTRAVEIIRNVRSLFQRDDAQMGPVDLKQVLFDVGRILAADAMFRKITLRSDLPASLPTIIGNRTQLLQALMNLVLNAFDAVCEDGVETREVEICTSEPEPGQVHVAVSDSGKGIDPSIAPRLFDAFFTTKAKGMGMGLAITRSIVENHGGRLWATRNSSGGATLEFELPVKANTKVGTELAAGKRCYDGPKSTPELLCWR